MDGDRPIAAGGDPVVTGMVTTMVIAMAITTVIVPVIGQDIMQVNVPHTTGLHPIRIGPGPPIMFITTVPRELEELGTINMMPGLATEFQQLTEGGPLHSRPIHPTMSIPTGTAMCIVRTGTTGTG